MKKNLPPESPCLGMSGRVVDDNRKEASCVTEAGDRARPNGRVCLEGCAWDPVVSSEKESFAAPTSI